MRVAEELRAYEAAGSLAEELPYWGWLDDGSTCLTRSGELVHMLIGGGRRRVSDTSATGLSDAANAGEPAYPLGPRFAGSPAGAGGGLCPL